MLDPDHAVFFVNMEKRTNYSCVGDQTMEPESQQEDTKPEPKIGYSNNEDWRLRLAVNDVDEFHPDRE